VSIREIKVQDYLIGRIQEEVEKRKPKRWDKIDSEYRSAAALSAALAILKDFSGDIIFPEEEEGDG
jgi:hypothetical protein